MACLAGHVRPHAPLIICAPPVCYVANSYTVTLTPTSILSLTRTLTLTLTLTLNT